MIPESMRWPNASSRVSGLVQHVLSRVDPGAREHSIIPEAAIRISGIGGNRQVIDTVWLASY
jgi:hypothetical protein